MGNLLNLTGTRFGILTVAKKSINKTKDGRILWNCLCGCGELVKVRGDHLTSGHTISCGCYNRKASAERSIKNLVGQRFGKLIVICDSGLRAHNGGVMWTCHCNCGAEINVRGDSLVSEHTKSCGCHSREINAEFHTKNLVSQVFGRLTVMHDSGKRYNGHVMWACRCNCGEQLTVVGASLINGNTRSCGCLQREIVSKTCGNKHPNWQGGKSFEPYPSTFNKQFKRKIRERDNYTCAICSKKGNTVHHIDYCKENTIERNCIVLCRFCHSATNFNRDHWQIRLTKIMRGAQEWW